MTRTLAIALVLIASLGRGPSAKACGDPPPATVLTAIIISLGPPITITLIFDPWTTFASDDTQFCNCAFRFPTSLIDTVDDVRFCETGTDILVPGFGPWTANVITSGAVEGLAPAGAGNEWFGFFSDLTGAVSAGTLGDFQVDLTLMPGVTLQDLQSDMVSGLDGIVFSDESESDGMPMDTHQGFTDATFDVPAVSDWGLLVMVLLTLTAGAVVFRRLRSRSVQT